MTKVYIKLIALSLTLVLSLSMVVAASYAWLVLSQSPEVSGIQVAIGGGNTILVAADLTETIDGVTYHYPDEFSDKLNFGTHDSYAYLNTLDGLSPVSTADGVNWFLPAYYDSTDDEVKEGRVPAGMLKDFSEFTHDRTLSHANLSGADEETLAEGSYIYLDFWVVSPGTEATLRISVPTMEGDDSGGTFLVDLLSPSGNAEDGYILEHPNSQAAASFRVGFLANSDMVIDNTMLYYQKSPGYDQRYNSLRGFYLNPGQYQSEFVTNHFYIYEPNGNYHPGNSGLEGSYVPTNAIGLVNGEPAEMSVLDRVTVQKYSSWKTTATGDAQTLMIEQIFRTAITGKDLTEAEMADYFYNQYLQGQISPYVEKGAFYKTTQSLAAYNGTVSAAELEQLDTAGATDDVYMIELERNIPQRIRMFIWLEGQDVDCTNVTEISSLVLNLEFAGSTADLSE